ncbi:YkvA family protein [Aquipseudomonas guryensis]|uniref:YkvA family protein n=1 Tax=Aquipseudomonas guryensis TaxID=2759165 RepID=UPI001C725582
MVSALNRLRHWARALKRDAHALWLAARDARTPKLAKLLALLVAAYALSPIDLIPDFVPVLGYLDDLIIVPLGIWLVVRLIPAGLMAEYRALASLASARPVSKMAASFVVLVWLALGAALGFWLMSRS